VLPVSVWLIWELTRHVRLDLKQSLLMPLLTSLTAAACIFGLKNLFAPSWLSVIGLALLGGVFYIGLLLLVERKTLLAEGKVFLTAVFKRQAAGQEVEE
jgi:hypothetical protein